MVESDHTDYRDVLRWVITGECQDLVERSSNALMSAERISSASFTFPGKIRDKADLRYGWYRTIGYTSSSEDFDAHQIHKRQ
jgi:hypothetical protein